LHTAKQHDVQPLSLFPTVPGIGTLRRRVRLSALHELDRCASVQDCGSSCRLGQYAQEAAGTRLGTAGKKIGPVHRKGALAEAATWCRRTKAAGPSARAGREKKQGQGKALTLLAHKLARAVY
jgi:hypothetical protein